jgi:hypothetical protein
MTKKIPNVATTKSKFAIGAIKTSEANGNGSGSRFLRQLIAIALASFCTGWLSEARGAAIQGVTISSFSSEYTSGFDQRRAATLVKDTGFFGQFHTAIARGSLWLTLPSTAGNFTNALSRRVSFRLIPMKPCRK